jgi:RimJ/RimL family protein N-acetyltransferase
MKTLTGQRRRGQHELIGQRLRLRDVRLYYARGHYLQWMNDQEVLKYTESRFHPYTKARLREYIRTINKNPDFIFRAITLRDSGRHIGNIKLGPVDWNHRFGDIGIIIGAKDCWGRGYAAESIRLLADFAFSSLKLHKLTAGCYVVNIPSIKAFEKAGFVRECLRPSQYLSDGRYVDLICFGLLNPADS